MGDMFFDLQSSESIFLHTLKTKGQEWKSRSLYREHHDDTSGSLSSQICWKPTWSLHVMDNIYKMIRLQGGAQFVGQVAL